VGVPCASASGGVAAPSSSASATCARAPVTATARTSTSTAALDRIAAASAVVLNVAGPAGASPDVARVSALVNAAVFVVNIVVFVVVSVVFDVVFAVFAVVFVAFDAASVGTDALGRLVRPSPLGGALERSGGLGGGADSMDIKRPWKCDGRVG
jgi:hypothetical protein